MTTPVSGSQDVNRYLRIQQRIKAWSSWWWVPASVALVLFVRIFKGPFSILDGAPLYRYQIGGPERPFIALPDLEAVRASLYWDFLFIAAYGLALALACIFFIRVYQSPWMRDRGWTFAAGALTAALFDAVANCLSLVGLNGENAAVESGVAALTWVSSALIFAGAAYSGFGLAVYVVRGVASLTSAVAAAMPNRVAEDQPPPRRPQSGRRGSAAVVSQALPVPDFDYGVVRSIDPILPERADVGVCSSGGGLRSSTFSLGAYQGLSEGIIQEADYLSAVSGGAYMAGAYSAVSNNLREAQRQKDSAYAHRSPEEQHLRANTNYLAPSFLAKMGVVGRVLLGLLINLIFIGAVIGLFALPWGWLTASKYLYPGLANPLQAVHEAAIDLEEYSSAVVALQDEELGLPVLELPQLQFEIKKAARELRRSLADRSLVEVRAGVLAVATQADDLVAMIDGAYNQYRSDGQFPADFVAQARVVADDARDVVSYIALSTAPKTPVSGGWLAIIIAASTGALIAVISVAVRRVNQNEDARTAAQRFAVLMGGISLLLLVTFVLLPWVMRLSPSDVVDEGAKLFATLQSIGAALLAIGAVSTVLRRKAGFFVALAGGLIAPLMAALALIAFVRIGARSDYIRVWILGCLLVYLIIMAWFDLNVWSLHPWYRRRLTIAFGVTREGTNGVQPITAEQELISGYQRKPNTPAPVICAAANVNEPGRTPTSLNALSFTFDSKHIGIPSLRLEPRPPDGPGRDSRTTDFAPITGSVKTSEVENRVASQEQEMRLLGAMAISGAAFSPAMGKMTQPSVQALLAMANLRLGVWLPNPIWLNKFIAEQKHGAERLAAQPELDSSASMRARAQAAIDKHRAAQYENNMWRERVRATYLFKEIFGTYRLTDKFLYVTDGGHWENLGLVELLRRRCRTIYCFDASGDETDRFKTLSEAVAIARTDLGIQLGDLDPYDQQSAPTKATKSDDQPVMRAEKNVSVFTFLYPDDTKGTIVYCKPVVTNESPIDVKEYQEKNPIFPAHSTLDQFFDHEQFEAYRMLGHAAGVSAAREVPYRPSSGLRSHP